MSIEFKAFASLQAVRHNPAVFRELVHYRPVQGYILLGRSVVSSMDAEFLGQFLASGQAGSRSRSLSRSKIELW